MLGSCSAAIATPGWPGVTVTYHSSLTEPEQSVRVAEGRSRRRIRARRRHDRAPQRGSDPSQPCHGPIVRKRGNSAGKKACRNRASEARTLAPRLAMRLAAGRTTAPVREVVERAVPVTPTDAHGWVTVLGDLARQLADPDSRTSREHWQHRRILAALADVTAALDRAHPGGIGRQH